MKNYPIIVAITGATGAIYGIEILKTLKSLNIPTHLIISSSGFQTITEELEITVKEVHSLATTVYNNNNIGAAVSSGSFITSGMIVAPCSVKTLSAIANSYDDNLITRAADVTLKERRKLVLLFRETPIHVNHIDLMMRVSNAGAIVMPPMPAFYNKPTTISDLVMHSVYRALDLFDIHVDNAPRWS